MKTHRGNIINILSIVSYVLFVLVVWYYISKVLVDKQSVRHLISGYTIFAPVLFILIQISQNVFAPVAHYPILLAGGFIFGPIVGMLYNWVGTVLGTLLIIGLAKKFGRPLIHKMVSHTFIKKYDMVVQRLSPFGLFLMYALPVFPDDEISYLIGISSMPVKSIVIAVILGKIPGASLSFIGDETINGMPYTIGIQIAVLIVGAIYYSLVKKNSFSVRNE